MGVQEHSKMHLPMRSKTFLRSNFFAWTVEIVEKCEKCLRWISEVFEVYPHMRKYALGHATRVGSSGNKTPTPQELWLKWTESCNWNETNRNIIVNQAVRASQETMNRSQTVYAQIYDLKNEPRRFHLGMAQTPKYTRSIWNYGNATEKHATTCSTQVHE